MVETKKRISLIDGVRGFSLLGILLANLLIFQYGIYGLEEMAFYNLSNSDKTFHTLLNVFVEGSFMPIFAIIFGYSLILMKQSLERKELGVKWHIFRRSVVLIGFGLLHSIYLWDGDILFMYGGMTIILLFFVNRKPKTLIIWGGIMFTLFFFLGLLGSGVEEPIEMLDPVMKDAYLLDAADVHANGTYSEILAFRNEVEAPLSLGEEKMAIIFILVPFVLLPMFLFGMYAAHKKALEPSKRKKRLYLLAAMLFIPIGVLLKSTMHINGIPDVSANGGMILSIGYIGIFSYLYMTFSKYKITTAFENVGKLSLTNYIMQTVICTYIFYGYGFGFFGEMGVINAFILGVVIFIIQIIASTVYLRYFKQGPLEKVMRTLIYLKLPKFLKRKRTVAQANKLKKAEG